VPQAPFNYMPAIEALASLWHMNLRVKGSCISISDPDGGQGWQHMGWRLYEKPGSAFRHLLAHARRNGIEIPAEILGLFPRHVQAQWEAYPTITMVQLRERNREGEPEEETYWQSKLSFVQAIQSEARFSGKIVPYVWKVAADYYLACICQGKRPPTVSAARDTLKTILWARQAMYPTQAHRRK